MNRKKQLSYRRAFVPSGQPPLGTLLLHQLRGERDCKHRLQNLADGSQRILTEWQHSGHYLTGVLAEITPGDQAPAIQMDLSKPIIKIEGIAPNKQGVEKASLLFFVARENHVAYIGGMGLQADQLENYLNWYLCDSKHAFPRGPEMVRLRARTSRRNEDQLRGARAIRIETSLAGTQGSVAVTAHAVPARPILDAITRVFGEVPTLPAKLSTLNETALGSLEVALEISLAGRKRRDKTEILHLLASQMGDDVIPFAEITLAGGRRISGDQIVVRSEAMVRANNGILDPTSAADAMKTWIQALLDRSEI